MFDYLFVEVKRPLENFFQALVQLGRSAVISMSSHGVFSGYGIVMVGKSIAFFSIIDPYPSKISWKDFTPLNLSGIDYSLSKPLYVDNDPTKDKVGDIWSLDNHAGPIHAHFVYIRENIANLQFS